MRAALSAVFLILAGMMLAPIAANAQLASMRGRIVDETRSPMDGVNVVLRTDDNRLIGTATKDGFYLINRIPPGRYAVTISFVGYVSVSDTISFEFADSRTQNYALDENEEIISTIVVEGERSSNQNRPAGLSIVSPRSLSNIPAPGLSRDLAAALTRGSGVVTLGDRGGQLYIRGGAPMQNLYLLDGMRILQPLHILNEFSVFPSDILSYADVYAGGFGAYYGGRVAAVVDVNTRNGNKKRFQGSMSVSPFLGAIQAEIPIVDNRASVIFSARESIIRDYGESALGLDLPYSFGDRFLKFHAFLNETSNFAFTALRSHDQGNLAGNELLDREVSWTNEAYGFNYFYLSQSRPVLTEITVSTTRFIMKKGPEEDPNQSTEVGGFEGSFNFAYLLGAYQLHFGIFAQTSQLKFKLGPLLADSREEFVTEGGAFVEGRIDLPGGLHVVPGIRAHSFPSRGQSYVEPRLQISVPLPISAGYSASAAWGIYHQEIVGLTDDRVASDIFTVWTPSPENRPVPRSRHALLGLSGPLGTNMVFDVEGYHRRTLHVAFPTLGEILTTSTEFIDATTIAKGIDIRMNIQREEWFGSVSYDLGSIEYFSGAETFRPPHDRRHTIRISAGTVIKGFKIIAGWQYGSGLPFTRLGGYYEEVPIDPEVEYAAEAGPTRLLFGESFKGRLPPFHRLDVSIDRTVSLSRRVRLVFQGSVVNAYDRSNWFDLDYVTLERVDQLPFIPSLGIKVEFK